VQIVQYLRNKDVHIASSKYLYTTLQFYVHKADVPVADPGGVDWVASHTPPPSLGFAVSIIFFVWVLSDLLEQTILVNQLFDEMQINHSDRE